MLRAILIAVLAVAPAAADPPATLRAAIDEHYDAHLRELFVHFHRNPELSFLETETARRMARELRALGVEVTEGVGGTGVVGMIRNGDGPLVLVRADMDGLPVKENSGLDYASTATQVNRAGEEVPVMHACGHDVHITALVGTAKQLVDHGDRWNGTVMLVVQPAEERIGGARAMLEDGLYERFGVPDYALAFHVSAGDPAGRVQVRGGPIASSADSVDIIVRGIGAHGASPHKGKDPIYIGAQIVIALQGIVSRELPPLQPGVVTVGAFHAGLKHNIIGDEARLQLTVRSNDAKIREQLLDAIERIAIGIGKTNGLPDELLPQVIRSEESTPPTVNDEALAARIKAAFERELGPEMLYSTEDEGMGAEDFAYFLMTDEAVPGCYFSVGGTPQVELDAAKNGGPPVPSHHSPFFKVDPDASVPAGVHAMTVAVMELAPAR